MNASTKNLSTLSLLDLQNVSGGLTIAKGPFDPYDGPYNPCPYPGPTPDPIHPIDYPIELIWIG